ncbi:hypothetical protein [Pleionea sp. CnH1-48]|uniref:hypothetical protein n=1 Tax=Pleionea sp. CnH1-48 TaxID=2954494 RepID=UPI002098259E|nr:hypothetical protein [Pleionea sp. CnH1-48]MCO7226718.1 hypothetical protein [Pleionea sp. CnH1-48]
MELSKPESWRCPDYFCPESDGVWEISELKALAKEVLKRSLGFCVVLDIGEQTCVFVSVFKGNIKLGEVYVNRKDNHFNEPIFSVFYGKEENEFHSSSYPLCAKKLLSSDGFVGE